MRGPVGLKPLIWSHNPLTGVEVGCAAEACILEIAVSAADVA